MENPICGKHNSAKETPENKTSDKTGDGIREDERGAGSQTEIVESRKTDEKRCRGTRENQTDNWTKKARRTESKGRRETADRTGDKQRNDLKKNLRWSGGLRI